jgi:hypothetical protein
MFSFPRGLSERHALRVVDECCVEFFVPMNSAPSPLTSGGQGFVIAIRLPEHLRQPRDVDSDPARLVLREHLRLPRFSIVVARVEARACPLASRITSRPRRVGAPGRREAAGGSGMVEPSAESGRDRPYGRATLDEATEVYKSQLT